MSFHIHVAIPALAEFDFLPATIECLKNQDYSNFTIYICVNQPESWWNDDLKRDKCIDNQNTLKLLKNLNFANLIIFDKSSIGLGWKEKEANIGFARKFLMDNISKIAMNGDIILSLDADTTFSALYLKSIAKIFSSTHKIVAHANPYFHKISGDENHDRKILRYEIYMRYYAINLWRINSPYAFTAFGSAIALPVHVYKKVGGITPKKSGEDFYFLQKLRKFGLISTYNSEIVYPSSRLSDRVFFGTGPALIRGPQDNWKSYPIYPFELFDSINETYKNLSELYQKDLDLEFLNFASRQNSEKNVWQLIRQNVTSTENFIKLCHNKLDGLTILQYLHQHHWDNPSNDNVNFSRFFEQFYPEIYNDFNLNENFSFYNTPIETLDNIRKQMIKIECNYQYNNFLTLIETK